MTTDMNNVFKALADPHRRELLDLLYKENGQTLGDLCKCMSMSRQGVAKHLALLEVAQLVVVVWQGREKLHYLNPVPIQQIHDRWIGKFEGERLQALDTLRKALDDQNDA
ncbi:transcriptional regulator [Aliidiomarina sedimenti]|uniref:Transcriptional regulator n=2 Tax=Aliidiomarina sedimenti TaxID=1933879 RepID=A0ABY0C3G4_9GAMM|nr:transcriptional regulator [Aliidiomarina sedimenti]